MPNIQRIMRMLVKTTTRVSLTELIFRNNVNHDGYALTTPELTIRHIKELAEDQDRMIMIAQENQEEHKIFMIAERSTQYSHTTHFPINS